MSADTGGAAFRSFDIDRPQSEGVYLWRVQSRAVPGVVVMVKAKMRMRGAGYTSVLSPEFDHWDGFRVIVPDGIQWRDVQDEDASVSVEGVSFAECPFCRKVPKIYASQHFYNGVAVFPEPWALNSWRLTCCPWNGGPSFDDPRKLADEWNAAAMLTERARRMEEKP